MPLNTYKKMTLEQSQEPTISNVIIAGKTYKINELNAIFSINALMLVDSKEELIKYWQMAVETGVKRFINNVDNVFVMRFPKYE